MSLEEHIAKLTEAVSENNDLMRQIIGNAKARSAAAAPEQAEVKAEKAAKAAKAAEKADDDEDKRGRGRPPGAKNKPKPPTEKELRAAATEFLSDLKGEEKARRKEFIEALLNEYGGGRITETKPEDWAAIIADLADFAAGKKVSWMKDGGDDEEDDEKEEDGGLI